MILLATSLNSCAARDNSASALADSGTDSLNLTVSGTCRDKQTHQGVATFYLEADGSGNCLFPATPNDPLVAALNESQYRGSAACGRCIHIQGPDGDIRVRVVDRCPAAECKTGHIDLHPTAFDRIAERSLGRVPITWSFVACDVDGPISIHFKDGSNPWWTAVQIRNHRHGITSLEAFDSDADEWNRLNRESYNYFAAQSGLGAGPYRLRISDVEGNQLIEDRIELGDNVLRTGLNQFPPCGPSED